MKLTRPTLSRRFIPLAPIVDVFLVLTIFFMMTSNYDRLEFVRLNGAHQQAAGERVTLRLLSSGDVQLQARTVSKTDLAAYLTDKSQEGPPPEVLLLPDQNTQLQALISLSEFLSDQNIAKIAVVYADVDP